MNLPITLVPDLYNKIIMMHSSQDGELCGRWRSEEVVYGKCLININWIPNIAHIVTNMAKRL